MLHSLSTLALSPSGPGALCTLSQSNSLATPFGSTFISPMEENGLDPFEGRSGFASHVTADLNCRLQISAFSLVSVFRISLFLSDVIPNASFFIDLTNDQNFLTFPLLFGSGSEGSFSNVKTLEMCFQ